MSACESCGAETIAALTPGGRVVELDVDHTWALPGKPGERLFIVGVSGGPHGSAVPQATPVLGLFANRGPYRKEHRCEAPTPSSS